MSINIAKTYIDFSNQCLKKYMSLIGRGKVSNANFKEVLNTYNNIRYYNYYEPISKNRAANLNHYINEKMHELYEKYSEKRIKELTDLVKLVLNLDFVRTDQIEGSVLAISTKIDDNISTELTKLLKNNLDKKIDYLNGFKTDVFNLKYHNTNSRKVAYVTLDHNVKFPLLYSEYAINKVYNSDIIDEQKLFIEYTLVAVKILKEIINNNFINKYIVDFPYSIFNKKSKKNRLLNIIDSDAIKDKLIIKINNLNYEANKDIIIDMIQNGYKMALEVDYNYNFSKMNIKKLEIFEYIIIEKEQYTDDLDQIKDKIIIVRK